MRILFGTKTIRRFIRFGTSNTHFCPNQLSPSAPFSQALAFDQIFTEPFVMPKTLRITQIGFYCNTISGTNLKARIGLYLSKPDQWYPGSLLVDGGEKTPIAATFHSTSIDLTIQRGRWIWIAYLCTGDVAGTIAIDVKISDLTSSVYAPGPCYFGIGSSASVYLPLRQSFWITQTYGALPASFPTGAKNYFDQSPMVYIR